MGTRKPKVDLSELPHRYVKKNKKWFVDSVTGKYISVSNIQNYLPKQEVELEQPQYWWQKID